MAHSNDTADYIVIGGGLTGCVVASRLSQKDPSVSVTLLEAGVDASNHPDVTTLQGAFKLGNSELDWAYKTLPDPNTAGREHNLTAGKVLGGGSVLNYAGWLPGDAADYNDWATAVQDDRWNFANQLPYHQKVEDFFDPKSPGRYGVGGPIRVASPSADENRIYGLREPIARAWADLGVKPNLHASNGSIIGISEILENWRYGKRQPAHAAWDLSRVNVVTSAVVQQISFTADKALKATGVILADGRRLSARKEVILSAGAIATPQILMLSGIGPQEPLAACGIPILLSAPEVGKNLHNHFSFFQYWKLRNPEKGLALGTAKWTHPAYGNGMPWDWLVNESVPTDQLRSALETDIKQGKAIPLEGKTLLEPDRSHVETMFIYAAVGSPQPPDGTTITSAVTLCLPTSRGSVSITSSSVLDRPQVTTNFYDTESDRVALIYGARRSMQALLQTAAGKEYIEAEITFPAMTALGPDSSDAEIDDRIRKTGLPQAHSAGTAAMGKVVDTELRVFGVQGLRVVDASVVPLSIGGHPQPTLYGLAEHAADLIIPG